MRSFPSSRAFTLIELLVVIAIITLLVSILSPSLRRAKEAGRSAMCSGNLHQVGSAFTMYVSAFSNRYPYGVPKPPEVVNHPQYETWLPNSHGGGVPPQQQFWALQYIRSLTLWFCPTDPHPWNYNWWEYDVHPDIPGGSSYMFSEQALFGVEWWTHRPFLSTQVVYPSTFALAADGWMCPNGWHWGTVDPSYELVRIDWSHGERVNFLYGDGHVAPQLQAGASVLIRTNPLNADPVHNYYP